MPYSKTTWVDRSVQYPHRYTDELANVKTFTASPGTITAAGTDINATNMNKIEAGVEAAQNGLGNYVAAGGSANAYTATFSPAFTAYTEGMCIAVKINADNTTASTINVNSLGAKAIKRWNGNDVTAGQLKNGSIVTMRYNGTNFILQGDGGTGTAAVGDVMSGKTFSNDTDSALTGTLSFIKSIQHGTGTWSGTGTTNDITISTVDTAVAIIRANGISVGTSPTTAYYRPRAALTSSTNLRLTIDTYNASFNYAWEVIEFSQVKSIQSGTLTSRSASNDVTITSVSSSKSLVFYTLTQDSAAGYPLEDEIFAYLTSGTNLRINIARDCGPNNELVINWQVIEFN